jgi:hypothetical protein
MIPKKNGYHKVTDYRNIHIYECDMNAMLSLKWKKALKNLKNKMLSFLARLEAENKDHCNFQFTLRSPNWKYQGSLAKIWTDQL